MLARRNPAPFFFTWSGLLLVVVLERGRRLGLQRRGDWFSE